VPTQTPTTHRHSERSGRLFLALRSHEGSARAERNLSSRVTFFRIVTVGVKTSNWPTPRNWSKLTFRGPKGEGFSLVPFSNFYFPVSPCRGTALSRAHARECRAPPRVTNHCHKDTKDSTLRSRKVIRDAPVETTALQKTHKRRAGSKEGPGVARGPKRDMLS
jgi:hypothetical protein